VLYYVTTNESYTVKSLTAYKRFAGMWWFTGSN